MTRVTAGAIPEFRAARRASVPLSNTLFRFRFIKKLLRSKFPNAKKKLKAERRLQIDAAIRRRLGKGPARESIRTTEKRRTQVADRRIHVHVVKDVPHGNRKGQAIAVIRKIAIRSTRSAPTKTTALSRPTSTRSSAERTAGAWTATGASVCGFRFFSKAKRFAQP
jgi:hypothetical protein